MNNIYLLGDIALNGLISEQPEKNQERFAPIAKLLKDTDLVFANLETPVRGDETKNEYKDFIHYSLPELTAEILKLLNIGCVSQKLKDYFYSKIEEIHQKNITVIPGAADQKDFSYNEDIRKKMRTNLNIQNKFIVCYTGKLDMPWHMADRVFGLMASLLKNDKIFFICITPDKNIAEKYIKKYKINQKTIFCKYAKYEQINQYLNAADCGIILREDVLTNNVVSPTKIAEYLLTGLPLLLSDNIGDYSEFVKKHELGKVFNNNLQSGIKMINDIMNWDVKRLDNGAFSARYYSKQVNLHKIVDVYNEL